MQRIKDFLSPGSKEEEEARRYVEQLRELLTHDCERGKREGELNNFFWVDSEPNGASV